MGKLIQNFIRSLTGLFQTILQDKKLTTLFIILDMIIVILIFSLGESLSDRVVEKNGHVYHEVYDHHSSHPKENTIKELFEPYLSRQVEYLNIRFSFRLYSFGDYLNAFQTAEEEKGVRLELDQNVSNFMLVVGNKAAYSTYKIPLVIELNRDYVMNINIHRKDIQVSVDNVLYLTNQNSQIDFVINQIAIGAGWSKLRGFDGRISNFTMDYRMTGSPLALKILEALFLCILVFLLFYQLKIAGKPIGTEELFRAKLDFLVNLGVTVVTIGCVVLVVFLIYVFYHPDLTEIQNFVSSMTTFGGTSPEPVERMQYMAGVVITPFILYLLYSLAKPASMNVKPSDVKRLNTVYLISIAISVVLVILVLLQGLNQAKYLYIINSIAYLYFFEYTFLYLPFILYTIFYLGMKDTAATASINKALKIFMVAFSVALLFCIVVMNICNRNNYYGYYDHLNAFLYAVVQTFDGKLPLLDFNNQYGMYPVLLTPLFKIIGLKIKSFSIVMSLLTGLAFSCAFFFLRKHIKNYWIAFLGFTSTVFFPYLLIKSGVTYDSYFQFWPLRILFPMLLLYLGSLYLLNQKKYMYYILLVTAAVGVFWNPDAGLIAFITLFVVLAYQELCRNTLKTAIIKSLLHIAKGVGMLLAVFAIYSLYIWIIRGTLPDIGLFISYINLFYILGFFMIPMPAIHPWNLVMLAYLSGIFYAVRAYWNKEDSLRAKLILLVSVLGIGVFVYYQGRSHDLNMLHTSYPVFILLALFADDLLEELKNKGFQNYGKLLVFIGILFVLSNSFISLIYNTPYIYNNTIRGLTGLVTETQSSRVDFIINHTHKRERVFIYANFIESVYYCESDTINCLNIPSSSEWFFKKNLTDMENFMQTNVSCKVFIEREDIPIYSGIFNERYTNIGSESDLVLYIPKEMAGQNQ